MAALRQCLKNLGLPITGKKAELVDRLAEAVVDRLDSEDEEPYESEHASEVKYQTHKNRTNYPVYFDLHVSWAVFGAQIRHTISGESSQASQDIQAKETSHTSDT